MIQNFEIQGGPDFGRRNLPRLLAAMTQANLDGFIIPHEDEYQNEYLPDCNERLMWATGFTGSAGAAIVTQKRSAVFVDGRYTLQVRDQVDGQLFSYETLEQNGPAKWLSKHTSSGERIGYDPKLLSPASLAQFETAAKTAEAILVPVSENPIDQAWTDRPPVPMAKLSIQPLEFSGESHDDKRARIAKMLTEQSCNAALITAPASIAWLLNIRGGDVMCSPLPLSTLILRNDGRAELYVHPDKVSSEVRSHLGNSVTVHSEDALSEGLKALGGQTVWVDPQLSSAFMFTALDEAGATVYRSSDPIMLPKACKNSAEIAGTKAAHIRDGVAIAKFLHWLSTEAQSGHIDEIQAAQQLERFRSEHKGLKDLSFETISGAGSNGAHCHYRVNSQTNLKLERGSLYLVDSGGQYQDGTTDITRTVAIGEPTEDMRRHYTLVLKGHIALASIRFPEGTSGHALDALARMYLWNAGLDYDHGTGHGVGVYLGVHEGPQRISKAPNAIGLRPGMIVSNEPGFYKANSYGIRIENLQYVHAPSPIKGGERDMLGFTNLTWAALDRRLIAAELLSDTERNWVDHYHAQVIEKIKPLLDDALSKWLEEACAPL